MFLELLLLTGLLTIFVVIFVIKSGNKQRPRRLRMGVFLDKPAVQKEFHSGAGPGDSRFCSVSMQGWRVEMEDSACVIPDLGGLDSRLKGWSFYAVFDGHAGGRASASCSTLLIECILPRLQVSGEEYSPDAVCAAVRKGFFEMDERLRKELTSKPPPDRSGTTAVAALISPKHVFIANCGDSRAVLVRDGKVQFSSADHKPFAEGEKARIEAAGGAVLMQRVNGSLAVSRALGDFDYKAQKKLPPERQLVSPDPDVSREQRTEADQILVLACDGVWDVMENEEVAELVLSHLLVSDMRDTAAGLLEKSLYKNSRDNMTAVIVTFPGAPKFSQSAADKDGELFAEAKPLMLKMMHEYVQACQANGTEPQMHMLMPELVSALDPIYEVAFRQQFVEEQFQQMTQTQPSNASKHLNSEHRKLNSSLSPVSK